MTSTTTDQQRQRRAWDGGALRAVLVTMLAGAYLGAWWTFSASAPRGAAPRERARPPELAAQRRPPAGSVWYEDLPPAQRPSVELPPGWHITGRAAAGPVLREPAAVPTGAARTRPGRIRTRSS